MLDDKSQINAFGKTIQSQRKTSDNYYNPRKELKIYGIPAHMIKSYEKKRQ